jgi:hypothetical protein
MAHVHTRTYTDTYIHTYIPWIHKCVTRTVGCGTSNEYTHIHNFYTIKYYKYFKKQYYRSSLHIKSSSTEYKDKVALNFALSVLRIVTLYGKPLKILMLAQNVFFLKQDRLVCEDGTYSLY